MKSKAAEHDKRSEIAAATFTESHSGPEHEPSRIEELQSRFLSFDVEQDIHAPNTLRQKIQDWRTDTEALGNFINEQLKYSQVLRENSTLDSIERTTADIEKSSDLTQSCITLKSDVRALCNYRQILETENYKRLLKQSRNVPVSSATPNALATPKAASAPNELEKTAKYALEKWEDERIQVERVLQEMEDHPLDEWKAMKTLLDLKSQLQAQLFSELLCQNQQINPEESNDEFAAILKKSHQTNDMVSQEVDMLLKLLKSVVNNQKDMRRIALLKESGAPTELIAQLMSKNEDLEAKLVASEQQQQHLQQLADTLKSTAETKVATTGSQTERDRLRLEQAIVQTHILNEQYHELQLEHADLVTEHCKLKEQKAALEHQLARKETQFNHVTASYEPRIQAFERTIAKTWQSFEQVQTNIDLLTSMYNTTCGEQQLQLERIAALTDERDALARNAQKLIRSSVDYKFELARQEKILVQVMAARQSVLNTFGLEQQKLNEARAAGEHSQQQLAQAQEKAATLEKEAATASQAMTSLREALRQEQERNEDLRQQYKDLDTNLKILQSKYASSKYQDIVKQCATLKQEKATLETQYMYAIQEKLTIAEERIARFLS